MPAYDVTCAFGGAGCGTPGGAIDRLLETTTAMREEGIDIAHHAVTIDGGQDGSDPVMSVRFTAPSEGIVGWHVYRARLPACGIRRIEGEDLPVGDGIQP